MPIYEYQCTACGHHFDTIQTFKEEALIHCPVCGEPTLKKLISAPAFHLKGSGWYVTDFKNQAKPNTESQGNKEATSTKKKIAEEAPNKALATESKKTEKSPIKKSDKTDE
ncbi:type I antifreeze protein [Candidatus Rickettsiella viridis]|uniref:Type I antifreeze protein n=1 Tax=Candidatus Rickettsiella viridis TaxID=676208 RepID=A0A2Z5UWK7_9COXI|nr:zinc ribbon domain-containing protein [Candidatus Rickettsiella viridis]BBB15300.1 type I antifreeze protein [Candidatus Rickettsiella viridis]